MHRHVASLGVARQLPQSPATTLLLSSLLHSSPSTRLVLPPLLASSSRQSAVNSSISRSLSSAPSTFRNATTQDTRPTWPSSRVPVASQLGLQRAFRIAPSYQSIATEAPSVRIAATWRAHRRWMSDQRRPEPPLATSNSASKASQNAAPKDASPASKNATEHATAATANKTLLDRLPHLHRPTKEELLAAASGFWHRVGIRFKWFSIRSMRPFNLDDIGAFLSWIFWGHVLWIVIGTTTFVSLLVLAVNTVFAQETVAGWVGNYLTKSSGVRVVFESAIVPKWKGGVITFQNVFVSRRPGDQPTGRAVSKGSSITAAAAAAEAAAADRSNPHSHDQDDGNYTQFDVTIDSVNVTLSFAKWFNGKGLLRDVEIHGVRGVIDRTHIQHSTEYVDPKSYRHEHNPGDFEIDNFKMEDVLLTIYQPNNFRPFTVSVFNCELPRLRKQWLFYDFMSANNMSGSFDDSLFTVHPRQVHGHTGVLLNNGAEVEGGQWKKHSRLRIDGLNIDHLNRGVEGPFSWIHEGNVDIVADVMIPNDADGIWTTMMSGIHDSIDRMEATMTSSQAYAHAQRHLSNLSSEQQSENLLNDEQETLQHGRHNSSTIQNSTSTLSHMNSSSNKNNNPPPNSAASTPSHQQQHQQPQQPEENLRYLILDMRIQLNDVRASVPLFTKDLSYVNNALVRPIVAYINTRRAFIPVTCRVVKRQAEFDGSWTVFDSGLLDDVSRETYEAFSADVADREKTKRRFRKVGLWGLQVAAQAFFIGLAGQFA